MSDNMSYPQPNAYLPPASQFYPSSTPTPSPVHIVPPSSRPDMTQRKRPKYTRSKTGCLTCRVKKIKCDETKPNCMRCTHGSRDCTWPDGVPTRKKNTPRRDDVDTRPSTAGSSGLSEASTPPARELTPPHRNDVDLSLLPMPSRPPSENYLPIHPLSADHESSRRSMDRSSSYSQSHQPTNTGVLSMIPESSYSSRYDHAYLNGSNPTQNSRPGMPPYRPLSHQPAHHWAHPPEPLDPYYHGQHAGLQERTLVGHNSSNDHSHNRYQ
ncbi:hypothetical protein CPB84DRAFT_1773201 [Gymnopilus junonius]|uniref:Zn(2)-C6 fungal-type domain-containing protein n=1 Tax=Gymnopilus junonius TaxID=109634 RepID=A0A9P5NPM9_GYMJU|nr:hypothetical protein CPB84DRAFT_1773201 [Gymnopilus junonius]